MKTEPPSQTSSNLTCKPESTGNAVVFDENATCDRCSSYGAYQFGTGTLCLECYGNSGSCCPEFGGDDLTRNCDV